MELMSLAARFTLDSSDYERGLDSAEKRSSIFADVLKANLVTKGIEVAIDGFKRLASAASGAVHNVVASYADYEQLVSGVETLFKTSSDTVIENAEKAYKTAGLSANEYMDTVTSFSEALIQSTGRVAQKDLDALESNLDKQYDQTKRHWQERIRLTKDSSKKASLRYQMEDDLKMLKAHNKEVLEQAKVANQQSITTTESLERAADLADLAIQDMSDNANKIGTDMSSIQNAYQGFAKANYIMLDNLKLGYGGTKEEMERLLKDAERLTGKKYDLSSYADIVEAIHAIQTEMGITGTTALEAEKTIHGSIASTKAAWQNLLVAMGRGEGISDAITAIVKNASNVVRNGIPIIENALVGISGLVTAIAPIIAQNLPGLVAYIIPEAVKAMGALISAVGTALPGLIVTILPILLISVTKLLTSMGKKLPGMANHISKNLPIMIKKIMEPVPRLLGATLPFVVSGTIQLVSGLVRALPNILSTLWQTIREYLISDLFYKISWAVNNLFGEKVLTRDMLFKKLKEIEEGISGGVQGIISFVQGTVIPVVTSIIDFIKEHIDTILPIVAGVVGGIAALNIGQKLSGLTSSIVKFFITITQHPFTLIIVAIGALIGWLVHLYQTNDEFRDKVHAAWESIKGYWENTLKPVWDSIKAWAVDEALPVIIEKLEEFKTKVSDTWQVIVDLWNDTLKPALDELKEWVVENGLPMVMETWEQFKQMLPDGWDALETAVESIGTAFSDFITNHGQAVVDWLTGSFKVAWEGVQTMLQGLIQFIDGAFTGDWEKAWDGLVQMVKAPFDTLKEILKTPINAVVDIINEMIEKVESAINTIVNGINSHVRIKLDPIFIMGKKVWDGLDWGANLQPVSWGRIQKLATGGTLREGQRAVVGEEAPEYLRVVNGNAIVTPMKGVERHNQEIVVPRQAEGRDITVILELDGMQFGRAVYRYGREETQRVGVKLAQGVT